MRRDNYIDWDKWVVLTVVDEDRSLQMRFGIVWLMRLSDRLRYYAIEDAYRCMEYKLGMAAAIANWPEPAAKEKTRAKKDKT